MVPKPTLVRKMGLITVIATGVSSMVGASINVVPFMIHRSVPDIVPYVLWAFAFAAIPALFAELASIIFALRWIALKRNKTISKDHFKSLSNK